MRLIMLGTNHRTATVDLREKLAVNADQLEALTGLFQQQFPTSELLVLSTCNRTEWYLARPTHETPTMDQLLQFVAQAAELTPAELREATIQREQTSAVDHLFRVAAGIESMVVGETQILGQVKRAYEQACILGSAGPVLHRVFQEAIATARKVRRDTTIGQGRVSVGSVAVDFARRIFDHFDDKTIVGIGAGEMAKTTLTHLKKLAPHRLWVVNRSIGRARELADMLDLHQAGGVRAFDDLDELLVEADIIVTSTGSTEPIITAERFKPLLKRRRYRPLFIIDIALPRDVDSAVGSLTNIYLYNLDDLQQVIAQSSAARAGEVQAVESIVNQAVHGCMNHIHHRDVGRMIKALRARLHAMGEEEQHRTLRKLAGAEQPDMLDQALREHTHRLINKILHLPLSKLDQREDAASLGFYAAALRRLFALDETTVGPLPPDEASADVDGGADAPGDVDPDAPSQVDPTSARDASMRQPTRTERI